MVKALLLTAAPHAAVFFITLIADVFWANYNMATADRKAFKAAFWSSMIILAGTLSTQIWLANHWVLVDSMIGAFIGTYIAIKRNKDKTEADNTTQLLVEEGHA